MFLKAPGLFNFQRLAWRACLAKRELVNFRLARVGALSARRDNVLAGQAGCALGEQISGLSSSRVSHPLSELDASLSEQGSLSQIASLSEFINSFLHLFFFSLQTELD